MQQAVNSASTRKVAQFPPIKSTGHVATLHPKSEEVELNIEPSVMHANKPLPVNVEWRMNHEH